MTAGRPSVALLENGVRLGRVAAFLFGATVAAGACSSHALYGGPGVADCGNGVVESGEQCDDGNAKDDDACHNDCTKNLSGGGGAGGSAGGGGAGGK